MQRQPPPPGVYVPVPTFFVPRTSPTWNPTTPPLCPKIQAIHTLHLAKAGITGLVLLGSTGEAIAITPSERHALISSTRAALTAAGYPDFPLIAGTATQSIPECIAQLQDAAAAGANWGLVLAPGFFAAVASQEGLARWFEAVADESPIPILVYHYPGVSNGVKIAPSTMERLAGHINIVGCKLSHGDVSHHAQIAASSRIERAGFATFTGLGQQLLAVLAVGGAGTIDGSAGFFPRSVVRLYELGCQRGKSEEAEREARTLQAKVSRVEELVVKHGTVGIKEAVARVLGIGERDGTRLPLFGGMPGGDEEWKNWEECFAELAAVERSLSDGKA